MFYMCWYYSFLKNYISHYYLSLSFLAISISLHLSLHLSLSISLSLVFVVCNWMSQQDLLSETTSDRGHHTQVTAHTNVHIHTHRHRHTYIHICRSSVNNTIKAVSKQYQSSIKAVSKQYRNDKYLNRRVMKNKRQRTSSKRGKRTDEKMSGVSRFKRGRTREIYYNNIYVIQYNNTSVL